MCRLILLIQSNGSNLCCEMLEWAVLFRGAGENSQAKVRVSSISTERENLSEASQPALPPRRNRMINLLT